MSKDQEIYKSLIETLTFLNDVGAGDPVFDTPVSKETLTGISPKDILQTVKPAFDQKPNEFGNNVEIPKPTVELSTGTSESVTNATTFKEPRTRPVNTDQLHKVHLQVQDLKRQSPPTLKHQSELVKKAQELAMQANTLEELKNAIRDYDGCPLKVTATHTVFSDGNPQADLMLIGEAPGADEDRTGLPFVGRSGQLLDKMMAAIGLNRQNDYYISNIIPWRPPGNRPPTPEETAICLPFIRRHIELKNPKYLICVGGTAAKALLNTKDPMGKLRGKWFDFSPHLSNAPNPSNAQSLADNTESTPQDGFKDGFSIPTAVLFHPSYLLRSPGQKRLAWQDLQKIQSYFLSSD